MTTIRITKLVVAATAACLAAFTPMAAPGDADAATYSFVGAGFGGDGSTWSDSRNWSPAGVPGDGDEVSILDSRVTEMPTVTLKRLRLSPDFGPNGSLSGSGTLTISEGLDWTGGTIAAHVILPAGSVSTIDAQTTTSLDAQMELAGTSNWSGTVRLESDGRGVVTNIGLLNADASTKWIGSTCCSNPARMVNDGTIAMSGAGTAEVYSMSLLNNGTIDTAAGTTLEVRTLGAFGSGASVTGAGRVLLTGGGITVEGDLTLEETATLELASPGALTGDAATLRGGGRFAWTGGTLRGSTSVSSSTAVLIGGNQEKHLVGERALGTGILRLAGPTSMSGTGVLRILTSGAITNTGTFTAEPGSVVSGNSCCANPAEFRNEGTVAVPRVGEARFAFLTFVHRGAVTVARAATLRLDGPALSAFGAGASLAGAGRTLLTRGAVLNGDVNLAAGSTLELSLGSLQGKGTLKGDGRFVWSGGELAGSLTVARPVATAIVGATTKWVRRSGQPDTGGGLLDLNGPTDLSGSGAVFLVDSSVLTSRGTFTIRPGTRVGDGSCCAAFRNEGALVMTAAAGPTTPAPARLTALRFVNSGAVKLTGAGSTLAVDRFTQTSGGRLQTVIAGPTAGNGYSRLLVGVTAALDGNLTTSKAAAFTPSPGQEFNVVSGRSARSGVFATVNAPGFAARYVPNGVDLLAP